MQGREYRTKRIGKAHTASKTPRLAICSQRLLSDRAFAGIANALVIFQCHTSRISAVGGVCSMATRVH